MNLGKFTDRARGFLQSALPSEKDFAITSDFGRAGLHDLKSRGSKDSIAPSG